MNGSWCKWIATAFLSLFVPDQLAAQPLFDTIESLEALVANSDTVLVGKIIRLHDRAKLGGEGMVATVEVETRIKGERQDLIGIPIPQPQDDFSRPQAAFDRWINRSSRLLIAGREERPRLPTIIELTPEMNTVMAADFTVVQNPEEVIRIAKETVARQPAAVKRFHTFRLSVPWSPQIAPTEWAKLYGTGGGLGLHVLVDERLEQRALDYIRTGDLLQKVEGAKALRYFKSDQNTALLKSLLSDPSWALSERAEHNLGIEVRYYSARAQAFETLKTWGVDVPEPRIKETESKPDLVTEIVFGLDNATAAELRALSRFKNLESLVFQHSPLTDEHLQAIGTLTQLRSLEIIHAPRVTDAGLAHLAGLKNLRYLDVGGVNASFDGLKALAKLESLEKLSVRRNQLTAEQKEELRRLRPNLRLEH